MIKKIFIHIINAIFMFVLLCALGIFVCNFAGIKPYVVLSGSMEPSIHTGSLAFVNTHHDFEDVVVDDVVAYEAPNGVAITHRVINIENNCLETKGDNNDVTDGFTTNKDNFIGLTAFSIPYAGYIFSYFSSMQGLIMLAIGMIALLIIEEMIKTTMKKDPSDTSDNQ